MNEDLRICLIGDSFVQGIGDPEYRGWVGRVLTAFNLGIRRNTSDDVLRRCWREVDPRVLPGADNRLVISFGSNDAVVEDGSVRVGKARCLDNLATLLAESRERAIHPLVIGPPPVVDGGEEHLRRTVELADAMAELCGSRDVPFVATTKQLAEDPIWVGEATAGDGAHPGSAGYQRLAELIVDGGWHSWIARPRL
ncbi:GDSL-type esterase/lipase family protein [Nocardia salmonicida]|uniref:GDSL-type esterase/lipase family protein n=1 Tax=Nocardia salmonicida TaxID=53431 RepID=UPI0007A50DAA|nr:GDSL-type esterase/lipase family protein [Nocardia salmonicida]